MATSGFSFKRIEIASFPNWVLRTS